MQGHRLVTAVRQVLPYLVGLSLGLSAVPSSANLASDTTAAFTATQLVRQFTLKNTVAQVSQGMQGYVTEVNGQQRAPGMGARPLDFPTDMGTIPSGLNLPQRDGAGRLLGYCAWDNTATISTAAHNAGQGVTNPLVYAVVSPGLNGTMQTTCASVLATGSGVGDDYVQVVVPTKVSSASYRTSVGTFSDLTAGEEGDVRLVRDTNTLYSYVGGVWQPVNAGGNGAFADDSAINGTGAISYTTGKVTVADFQAAAATLTGLLTGNSATFSGAVTANTFIGNGSGLTDLNASNFSTGTLPVTRGGTGVDASAASNGTLLIGNGSGFTLGTITAGAGISVLNSAGAITINNNGVVSIAGTADQIITSAGNGNVVLSLPQAIATNSVPTFGGMMLNGSLVGTAANFSGVVTAGSLSAQRLDVGTSAGSVSNPNLIIGTNAMPGVQSGNGGNSALGVFALFANTNGQLNTATGLSALMLNTTGSFNTASGFQSLVNNTTGFSNSAFGINSLLNNTTGFNNAALGGSAGVTNTTGNNNTFLGATADATSGGLGFATAIGADSRVATSNTIVLGRNSAVDQIVIGSDSRNDTFANTKLYVNGVTNLNGDLRGTTATFSGAVSAARLNVGNSTGVILPNLVIGNGAVVNAQSGGGANTVLGINGLSANSTGTVNTSVGYLSMQSNTTGNDNLSAGGLTLYSNTTGSQNTAVGKGAMYFNSTGGHNVGVGYDTLLNNTTGSNNTAVGALADVTNGALQYATAIGAGSTVATSNTLVLGRNSTTDQVVIGTNTRNDTFTNTKLYVAGAMSASRLYLGDSAGVTLPNIVIGNGAVVNGQSGGGANTVLGINGLSANSTGTVNTSVGYTSMQSNITGNDNLAAGGLSLFNNTSGSQNTAVGKGAMYLNSTGGHNVGVGYDTLLNNTTGSNNTAVGALADVTTGALTYATAIGAGSTVATSNTLALGRNSATDQVVIGTNTRDDTYANTKLYVNGAVSVSRLIVANDEGGVAFGNIIIGSGTTMSGTQSGTGGNVAVGVHVLQYNSTGANNVGMGYLAMRENTTGVDNVGVGFQSLNQNTTGNQNTGVGRTSLALNTTGTSNSAFGYRALNDNSSGNNNTAVGAISLANSTTGSFNTALGRSTGGANTTGRYNTFVGAQANVASAALDYATAFGADSVVATNNTIVLGALGANKQGSVSTTDDQVVIGGTSRSGTHKLYVVGSGLFTGTVTSSSDIRLKTNINQLDVESMLTKLGQIGAYSYNYTAHPEVGKKVGVIAQELQNLFPEVANYGNGERYLSVDYGALGAMAAVGVGQLNNKFTVLNKTVTEQGEKLLELGGKVEKHDSRIAVLESWKTDAVARMDGMQTAIDLNIQKIADHAVAIQTNTKAIERLDDALLTLDDKVKGNTDAIGRINERWARNFSASEDGSLLTVNAVELKVSNFSAGQVRAEALYSKRLEAEMARIAELEVNNLRANTAVANAVQAEQVNTGSAQVYAGVGMPALLFAAKTDGHYTVSTSALDGSYATATVIVNAGQAQIIPAASKGIELMAEGNMVKAVSAGKSIKATWIKMG